MEIRLLKSDARIDELYDLSHTAAAELLQRAVYPWEVLRDIGSFIAWLGQRLSPKEYDRAGENIWIAKNAKISPSASVSGSVIICGGAQLRQGAFIRGNAIVGREAVVGNSTELKNCILFDNVQVPHFNYVGDSILGYRAHMGAGAVISNVKGDRSEPVIHCSDEEISTGLKKCGAFLGDFAEIGCGSVLNPGTVIGKSSQVYPLSSVRGCVPKNCIFKGERGIYQKI